MRSETDFDVELVRLECEWRQCYEASIAARAEYHAIAANGNAKMKLRDAARERLDRAEAANSRIMAQIEKLENHMLSQD